MTKIKEKLSIAEELTNTNPTEGQKSGGNYKKGKVIIRGLKISIENPVGSIRSGIDASGNEWSNKMLYTYGYFNSTVGKDGDPIDVFLGPIVDESFDVYIIDQVEEESRAFDEHKVMFGFRDILKAKKAYSDSYNKGWKGFSHITTLSLSKFKLWIKNKDAIKYPARRLNMSKKIDFRNSASPRIKLINLKSEVVEEVTLKDLQKQAGDVKNFDTLVLEISCPGGSVSEGLMIMIWLDALSQQGKEIVTIVSGNAYSIASLIMLAADIRLISKHAEVMVHNPMVPELKYVNADELEKYAQELRDLESVMYELYEIFTKLKPEQIKALMDNETYLSPKQAVENGFAQVVIDMKPKPYVMACNSKKEINMLNTLNILNRVICVVNGTDFVNQLYYGEKGGEIEIFQQDPSSFSVGDRTSIEGGEFVLSDGSKLKIEEFKITDISKAVEEVAEFNVGPAPKKEVAVEEVAPVVEEILDPAAPVKKVDEMPGRVIEVTESKKTTKEVIAMEGPAPKKVAVKEEPVAVKEEPVAVKEEPVAVKEEPVAVKEEPVAVKEEPVAVKEEPVAVKEDEDKPTAKKQEEDAVAVKEEPVAVQDEPISIEVSTEPVNEELELKQMLIQLSSLVETLVEKIGVIEGGQEAVNTKIEDLGKFEQVATEAIDALATNTVSNFKPEAKSKVIAARGGSIFQKAKDSRGI